MPAIPLGLLVPQTWCMRPPIVTLDIVLLVALMVGLVLLLADLERRHPKRGVVRL